MTPKKDIGSWLRERREELGLSRPQVQVHTRGRVSVSHLQKVEGGERRPSATVLRELASVYRVEALWLLKLGGVVPEDTPVTEPEMPEIFTSWEQIQRAVRNDKNLTPEERRGVLFNLKRLVKPILDEAAGRRVG